MPVFLARCSGFSGGDRGLESAASTEKRHKKTLQAVKTTLGQTNVSLKSTDGGIAAGAARPDCIALSQGETRSLPKPRHSAQQ